MSDVDVQLESFAYLAQYESEELEALLQDHWQEVAQHKKLMKLNPYFSGYIQAEKEGRLQSVVARRDGKLVGYSAHWIIKHHPHYRHVMVAEDDIHYLIPELRGTGLHQRMRSFSLEKLKKRGVHFVTARTKVGHGHENSLTSLGYAPLDVVYGLNLVEWQPREEWSAVGASGSRDTAVVQGSAQP